MPGGRKESRSLVEVAMVLRDRKDRTILSSARRTNPRFMDGAFTNGCNLAISMSQVAKSSSVVKDSVARGVASKSPPGTSQVNGCALKVQVVCPSGIEQLLQDGPVPSPHGLVATCSVAQELGDSAEQSVSVRLTTLLPDATPDLIEEILAARDH